MPSSVSSQYQFISFSQSLSICHSIRSSAPPSKNHPRIYTVVILSVKNPVRTPATRSLSNPQPILVLTSPFSSLYYLGYPVFSLHSYQSTQCSVYPVFRISNQNLSNFPSIYSALQLFYPLYTLLRQPTSPLASRASATPSLSVSVRLRHNRLLNQGIDS